MVLVQHNASNRKCIDTTWNPSLLWQSSEMVLSQHNAWCYSPDSVRTLCRLASSMQLRRTLAQKQHLHMELIWFLDGIGLGVGMPLQVQLVS